MRVPHNLSDNSITLKYRIKEAGKGYFHDLNMTRKHGGKTWIAPRVLIKEDVCFYSVRNFGIECFMFELESPVPPKYSRKRPN